MLGSADLTVLNTSSAQAYLDICMVCLTVKYAASARAMRTLGVAIMLSPKSHGPKADRSNLVLTDMAAVIKLKSALKPDKIGPTQVSLTLLNKNSYELLA